MITIRRAAVLGAGTMGSRIAAHLANAGVPVVLLDLTRDLAAKGLAMAGSARPPAFFHPSLAALVSTGSFDEDLAAIAGCDWILEAVAEDAAIKRALWTRVAAHAKPGAILSTNTSGIPLHVIAEALPVEARAQFLGTHFFNPPRYLRLVELIATADTAPALLAQVAEYCDRRLGKGAVVCGDTPNFIGNRVGAFFAATACHLALENGFTVEEADALTGPFLGVPNTATFRLLDLIGLDIWDNLLRTVVERASEDPCRDRFIAPPIIGTMRERGWLGNKTGQGFYRKTAQGMEALDLATLEYRAAAKPSAVAGDFPARVKALIGSPTREGEFVWRLLADYFLYAAWCVPTVAARVVDIDRVMRWGYGHRMGPFELWDALGFTAIAKRMAAEGRALPAAVETMLRHNGIGFYRYVDAGGAPSTEYFDLAAMRFRALESDPGIIALSDIQRARGVLMKSAAGTATAIGEGVVHVELGANDGAAELLATAFAHAEALVVSGTASPALLANAPCPVVAMVAGKVVDDACAFALAATRIQASADVAMGFGAALSTSAWEARQMGLLRDGDAITMNPDRLLADARRLAVALAWGDAPFNRRETRATT